MSGALSPENRRLLIGWTGVLALVFAFVFSNVAANHAPKPHELPVGVAGSSQTVAAVSGQLEHSAPGAFEIHSYSSSAAARSGILDRRVYGAFEPGTSPTLLVASAASRPAESVLEETFRKVTRSQGQTLVVRDLVPLPASDSTGATSFSVILSLIIAGVLGTSIIYTVTRERPLGVRLAAVVALGIGAGLVTALATNVVVGAFPDDFLAVWGVATMFVLAVALPVSAFQVLLGLAGTGVGLILFLVIGNPASGGSSAPELLPGFWRAVSQLLPPGAATTAMRDVVYFNGHGSAHAFVVLAAYAVLGAVAAIVIYRLRGHSEGTTPLH